MEGRFAIGNKSGQGVFYTCQFAWIWLLPATFRPTLTSSSRDMKRYLTALLIYLVACGSVGGYAAAGNLPEKATTDKSEYRKFTLDNGMSVILLSDPALNVSSASVAVKVGSMADPKERYGLAHFLEHMLFLGTVKYPEEGEYGRYLRSNGGYNNAYTSMELTNYHFEIAHHAFEGALDRLSQFFIAPLFTEEFTEREMNAVDSEFEMNLQSDGWRIQQIRRHLSREDHPYNSFSTGNLGTLEGIQREEFINFFNQYYSANLMGLALTGNASLDQMEAWVREYFSPIENKGVERIRFEERFLEPIEAARIVYNDPVVEAQDLSIIFNIPSMRHRYKGKSAELLSYVLGYEGEGSLLSKLKEQGLATGVYAYPSYTTDDFGILYTGASLTPKGLENYEQVLEVFFSYFELLRNSEYPLHIFEEQALMARFDELYKDKGEGANRAVALANAALNYPLEDAERIEYIWEEPDVEGYFEVLDNLQPGNMLATVVAKGVPTDQEEPFFKAPFSYSEKRGSLFQRLSNPPEVAGLMVPSPNPFIPKSALLMAERPVKVIDEPGLVVYYSQDQEFERPRSAFVFRFRQPKSMTDLESSVLKSSYVAAVSEMMNEVTYTASLAGLSFNISENLEGITISVDGYGESTEKLLEYIVSNLTQLDLPEERFSAIKDLQIRSLESFDRQDAYIQAIEFHRKAGNNKYYTPQEILSVARDVSLADVETFGKRLFKEGKLEAVIHGNLTRDDAVAAAEMVRKSLGAKAKKGTEVFELKAQAPKPGEDQLIETKLIVNNSTYWQEYIMGEDSPELRAASIVLRNFMSAPFYSEMRTRQQLGYIVWAFTTRRENLLHSGFVIQSADYDPRELRDRAETFIATLPEQWNAITDEQFTTFVEGAKSEVAEKDKSIAEKAQTFFSRAFQHDGDWDRQIATLSALDNITRDDVFKVIQRTIDPNTRRLRTVLAYADQHDLSEEVAAK